jgi:hypothetical protein
MFDKGDRFKHATKPEWQIGQVYDVSSSGKLHMYFVGASRKCLDPQLTNLIKVAGDDAQSAILDTLHDPTWPFAGFSLYVIELNECVWNESSFRNENPNRDPSKSCLYVGMTWHSPEIRFNQHMKGEHPGRMLFATVTVHASARIFSGPSTQCISAWPN